LLLQAAQPALLYIVPGVLGFVFIHAAMRGEVRELFFWHEKEEGEAEQGQEGEQAADAHAAASSKVSVPVSLVGVEGCGDRGDRWLIGAVFASLFYGWRPSVSHRAAVCRPCVGCRTAAPVCLPVQQLRLKARNILRQADQKRTGVQAGGGQGQLAAAQQSCIR
jgi:hypothetical protein